MSRSLLGTFLIIVCMAGFCNIIPVSGSSCAGFTENKGQLRDQSGNVNPAVLYSKDFGGMKVLLRNNGFSYELYQVRPEWADPVFFNFSSSAGSAFGNNLRNMGGIWAIWGADVNQDGIVDSGDLNLARSN